MARSKAEKAKAAEDAKTKRLKQKEEKERAKEEAKAKRQAAKEEKERAKEEAKAKKRASKQKTKEATEDTAEEIEEELVAEAADKEGGEADEVASEEDWMTNAALWGAQMVYVVE